jgi:pSer/pThr/pTyr-binding forkhead associated (FHA) protein
VSESIGIGSEIGGYRVAGLIGQGGMSAVYLADSVATGRQVALKVLASELASSEEFRRRFLRESRYASSLNQPNIVRVHAIGESDGLLYMAMDYIRGADLKTLLALEGPLEAERALRLLGQVASALDAVHASGVYHRDVKPGNVIVASGEGPEERDHCYLTDFGLSKNPSQDSRALTAAGAFVGTYHYTAPEQILGKEIDAAVDVYSLGCLVYECLTGEPPFQGKQEAEVLHAHIEEPPPPVREKRPDLPPRIDQVVAKAMAKSPADRYATCAALIQAARAAVSPAATPRAAAPERLRLEVTAGRARGSDIQVEDELVIGRHAQGEGALAGDIELSRRHARISRGGGGYVIEDLGSTNGTYLNGRRLRAAEPLSVGDEVVVGGTALVVRPSATTPGAASRPPPPPLTLRIALDPGSGEAHLQLDDASEPIRLVYEGGRWSIAPGDGRERPPGPG